MNTHYDCTYCGGSHDEEAHGDALVVRQHYTRDRAETVDTMLADAEELIESLPRHSRERSDGLNYLNQARALAESTSEEDYAGELGWDIVRENIDAIDGALWAAGFVPVWDAGEYIVLASVDDGECVRCGKGIVRADGTWIDTDGYAECDGWGAPHETADERTERTCRA